MVQRYNPFILQGQREDIYRQQQRADTARQQDAQRQQQQAQFAQKQQVVKEKRDLDISGRLALGIREASPESKQAAYKNALQVAEQYGIDLQGMPTQYTKEVDPQLGQLISASGVDDPRRKMEMDIEKYKELMPYKMQVAKAGSTKINTGDSTDPISKKYYEKMGGFQAQEAIDIQKTAKDSRNALTNISRLENLVDKGTISQGMFGGLTDKSKEVIGNLVGDQSLLEGVSDRKAAQTIIGDFVMGQIQKTKGAVSEKEMAYFEDISPSLAATPEGLKLQLETIKKIKKRDIVVARKAREYASKNKGIVNDGFYDELADWSDKNPVFDKGLRKKIDAMSNKKTKAKPKIKTQEFDSLWDSI